MGNTTGTQSHSFASSLRFNESSLSHFASSTPKDENQRANAAYLGWLHCRTSSEEGLCKKYAMLKANMLFLFRTADTTLAPSECILLENVQADLSVDHPSFFTFHLAFPAPHSETYYFGCDTQAERDGWVKRISWSTYASQRSLLLALQQRLIDLTGQDPLGADYPAITFPQIPEGGLMEATRAGVEPSTGLEVVDLHLSCTSLEVGGQDVGSFVEISISSDGINWTIFARTTIMQGNSPSFPHAVSVGSEGMNTPLAQLWVRFVVVRHCLRTCASATTSPILHSFRTGVDPLEVIHESPADLVEEFHKESQLNDSDSLMFHQDDIPQAFLSESATPSSSESTSVPSVQMSMPPRPAPFTPPLSSSPFGSPLGALTIEFGDTACSDDSTIGYFDVPLEYPSEISAMKSQTSKLSESWREVTSSSHLLDSSFETQYLGIASCSIADILNATNSTLLLLLKDASGNAFGGQLSVSAIVPVATTPAIQTSAKPVPALVHSASSPILSLDRASRMSSLPLLRGPFPLDSTPTPSDSSPYSFQRLLPKLTKSQQNYLIPSADSAQKIKVSEFMMESAFCVEIPVQYVRHLTSIDSKRLGHLLALGPLLGRVETVRTLQIKECQLRLERNQSHLKFLTSSHSYTFKPSVQRASQQLEMMPTNCHWQFLKVSKAQGRRSQMTVTTGVCSAHSLGYKRGGLIKYHADMHAARKEAGVDDSTVIEATLARLAALQKIFQEHLVQLSQPSFRAHLAPLDALVRELAEIITSPLVAAAFSQTVHYLQPATATAGTSSSTISTADLLTNFKSSFNALTSALQAQDEETIAEPANLSDLSNAFGFYTRSTFQTLQNNLLILELRNEYVVTQFMDMTLRHDIVFCQALTQLVTAVVGQLQCRMNDPSWLAILLECGLVVQMESLLSTSGNEHVMIEDLMLVWKKLSHVSFKFLCIEPKEVHSRVRFEPRLRFDSHARYELCVELFVNKRLFDGLPLRFQEGGVFAVVPVLFTMGINEQQTLAMLFDDTSIQHIINCAGARSLQKYVDLFVRHCMATKATQDVPRITDLMLKIDKECQANKSKNVDLLIAIQEIIQLVGGARLICCKSGKDRTSMSVTLEQCLSLIGQHGMHPEALGLTVDLMRTVGTRRDNLQKNIGERRYAFNMLQCFALPKLLRPPVGTFGSSVT
eukprot:m.513514 g.513514  ORF g.513514 m.513514 type:complete len:1173 (+) comp57441_c0_seq1:45-3563(+)